MERGVLIRAAIARSTSAAAASPLDHLLIDRSPYHVSLAMANSTYSSKSAILKSYRDRSSTAVNVCGSAPRSAAAPMQEVMQLEGQAAAAEYDDDAAPASVLGTGQLPLIIGFRTEAQARMVAVVGRDQASPWGGATWKEVLVQMGRKLTRRDPELEMVVLEDDELLAGEGDAAIFFRNADIVVAVSVQTAAAARAVMRGASHVRTQVAFDCHPELRSRLGGVEYVPVGRDDEPHWLMQTLQSLTSRGQVATKMVVVQEVWHRASSDNVLVALQLLINNYVRPVASLQKLQGQGLLFLGRALWGSGAQIWACLLDPEARRALVEMQKCDPTDQLCTYRCIAQHENANLRDLSFSLLEKNNALGLNAAIPMHLAVEPIHSFRGRAMTHELAEDLLIGWSQRLGWSWKIAGNMFPIASQFRSQVQTFYRESAATMWYDPVFQVTGTDGRAIWRRRHYSVRRAPQPGSFFFAFLDNGVTTREFWTIVNVAEDLSWAVFHSLGAARRTGQTFTGAVVCTPTGEWPATDHLRLYAALDKCDIKDWETLRVDHSSYAGAPRLGPPEHVPTQVFLGVH